MLVKEVNGVAIDTKVEKPSTRPKRAGTNGNGHHGNGSRKGGGGGGGSNSGDNNRDDNEQNFSPIRYRIGIWLGCAAILATFAALTFAYLFRSSAKDWQPLVLPRLLWLSTALILASSITFEAARKFLKRKLVKACRQWLLITVLLGLGFLIVQLFAWRQLTAREFISQKIRTVRSFIF